MKNTFEKVLIIHYKDGESESITDFDQVIKRGKMLIVYDGDYCKQFNGNLIDRFNTVVMFKN